MSTNIDSFDLSGKARSLVHFFSSFEAILGEFAIGMIFFVYLVHSNSAALGFNTTEYSSITVNWKSPKAYVFQTNTPNSTCQPEGNVLDGFNTSCKLKNQYPGQRSDYNVIVKDVNGTNYTYKTSYGTASSGGSGPWETTAKWDWTYGVAVFPSNFSDCRAAGVECKAKKVITNDKSVSTTFDNLKPNTNYKKYVCVPDCGNGAAVFTPLSQVSAIPAKLSGAITNCSGSTVNVAFGWTPASGGQFDSQFIDYSVYDNNFSADYVGKLLTVGQNNYPVGGFAPGVTYFWRVNTHLAGSPSGSGWVTSATTSFKAPQCTQVVTIQCQHADFNKDGGVNVLDVSEISKRFAPAPYDARFDLDKNGKVDEADSSIVVSKFGLCYPRDYATGLRFTTAPVGDQPGCQIKVTFNWYPATSTETFTKQYSNIGTSESFAQGTYSPIYKSVGVGVSTTSENLYPGQTVYWRVNTMKSDGTWNASAVKKIVTPQCVKVPTNLSVVPSLTETIPGTSTKCSSNPTYNVAFSWQNSGTGWKLNVSDSTTNYTRPVDNIQSLFAPDGSWVPAVSFKTGVKHVWHINNGANTYGPEFNVPSCASPGGNTGGFSQDAMKTYLKNTFAGRTIIVPNACNDGSGYYDCPVDYGKFLYGLAGSESTWDQTNKSVGGCIGGDGNCHGLFQYSLDTWAGIAARLSARTGKSYDIYNGWDQIAVTDFVLFEDPTAVAYTINLHWKADVDLVGREWNQFVSGY